MSSPPSNNSSSTYWDIFDRDTYNALEAMLELENTTPSSTQTEKEFQEGFHDENQNSRMAQLYSQRGSSISHPSDFSSTYYTPFHTASGPHIHPCNIANLVTSPHVPSSMVSWTSTTTSTSNMPNPQSREALSGESIRRPLVERVNTSGITLRRSDLISHLASHSTSYPQAHQSTSSCSTYPQYFPLTLSRIDLTEEMTSHDIWITVEHYLTIFPQMTDCYVQGYANPIPRELLVALLKFKPETSKRELFRDTTFSYLGKGVSGETAIIHLKINGFLKLFLIEKSSYFSDLLNSSQEEINPRGIAFPEVQLSKLKLFFNFLYKKNSMKEFQQGMFNINACMDLLNIAHRLKFEEASQELQELLARQISFFDHTVPSATDQTAYTEGNEEKQPCSLEELDEMDVETHSVDSPLPNREPIEPAVLPPNIRIVECLFRFASKRNLTFLQHSCESYFSECLKKADSVDKIRYIATILATLGATRLNLSRGHRFLDIGQVLWLLSEANVGIVDLNLSYNYSLRNSDIKYLLSMSIVKLNLFGCPSLSNNSLRDVAKISTLKELTLGQCEKTQVPRINDKGIKYLAILPLTHLHFLGLEGLSDKGLMHLYHMPLRELTFECVPNVTNTGIAQLLRKLPLKTVQKLTLSHPLTLACVAGTNHPIRELILLNYVIPHTVNPPTDADLAHLKAIPTLEGAQFRELRKNL